MLLLISSFTYAQEYQYLLSAVAIFQNEADYLKEWIEYHKKVGVEHFLLYNNNSTDHYKEILQEYIDQELVTLIEWPSFQLDNHFNQFCFEIQPAAYNDAIVRCKGKSKWLAVIDTDEFVVSVKSGHVANLLEEEYPNVSGLFINWQCYGTSHVLDSNGSLLKKLVYKLKSNHNSNTFCKSIVQPLHVDYFDNPHFAHYLQGYYPVDPNFNRLQRNYIQDKVLIDKIRINHYWARDENFFWKVKIPRYLKWGRDIEFLIKYAEEMNDEYDPILVNY